MTNKNKKPLTEGTEIAEPKVLVDEAPLAAPPAPTPTSNILSGDELAEIKNQLKAQLFEEMKDEATKAREAEKFRREQEDEEHAQYNAKMKESPDPWVDIMGWVRTNEGVKIELDWNPPFVDYLKASGIRAADDEQVVQKWVTLLLRDMADDMEEKFETKDSEFG